MRFKPRPYRDLVDKRQTEQTAEIAVNWLAVSMAIISIALFLISYQYVFSVSQALAAESVWHKLENETPAPERNIYVYWSGGECARRVYWRNDRGFFTSSEIIIADKWLYAIKDKPIPVEYCTYE